MEHSEPHSQPSLSAPHRTGLGRSRWCPGAAPTCLAAAPRILLPKPAAVGFLKHPSMEMSDLGEAI